MNMMNLSENIISGNSKIDGLAKAKIGFDLSIPPAKAGGNSRGGQMENQAKA